MRTHLNNINFSGGHAIVGGSAYGDEAAAQFLELKPDLVTRDVVMPEMNGIDAIKEIKACDPDAGVTMCSAVRQEQMVKLAVKNGARGYLVKPFHAPGVLEEIKNVLDS